MHGFWQDVRFSIRNLRENPGFTLVAALSLGLAIAGNAIVFSLINGLLYRPMPYQEPERILILAEHEVGGSAIRVAPVSTANFLDWKQDQTSFSKLALFRSQAGEWGNDPETESIRNAEVTHDFFDLLGVVPWQGRAFGAEDLKNERSVTLLTHEFWSQRLEEDPKIVGRSLIIDGQPHTVIGILPKTFEFLDPNVDVWTLLSLQPDLLDRQKRDVFALARLQENVSEEQATAELKALAERLREQYPEANRGFVVNTLNLRQDIPDAGKRKLFIMLQGALVFVLLIACANIAHLLLARGQKRNREMALRACLGASSPRLIQQMLTESLVLATLGGTVGWLLGLGGIQVMQRVLAHQLPQFYAPVMDIRVSVFTLTMTVLCTLAFGLFPAWNAQRSDHVTVLKDGGHGLSLSRRRRVANQALVVAEITLALILLGGAAILIRGFLEMQHTDPGFDTSSILIATARLPDADHPSQFLDFSSRAAEELQSFPGILHVAVSDHSPRTPALQSRPFEILGRPTASDLPIPTALQLRVTPTYFEALGIPLMRGRFFHPSAQDEASVVVINRTLARQFWPEEDPIGKTISIQGTEYQIVGQTADVQHGHPNDSASSRVIYLPWNQDPRQDVTFVIHADVPLSSLTDDIRRTLSEFDGRLVLHRVIDLDQAWTAAFSGPQIFSAILGAFGALALFLATLGTYGVLAYLVGQRGREIGIRLAMGAKRRQVLAMVVRQGLALGLIGISFGLIGLWAMQRIIMGSIDSSATFEPLTASSVTLLLLTITVLASWLPARRAARVDPGETLRSE